VSKLYTTEKILKNSEWKYVNGVYANVFVVTEMLDSPKLYFKAALVTIS